MKPSSSVKEVDWEVLPPEEKRKRQGLEPLFKWLALIMAEFIRVPGTKFKFGLDPLIGLLPGLGDTGSALVSYSSRAPWGAEDPSRPHVA